MTAYPADESGRQPLAEALTRSGYRPTQPQRAFNRDVIEAMDQAMKDGSFAWFQSSLEPVILGQGSLPQIQRIARNYRPIYRWVDVLPDVN